MRILVAEDDAVHRQLLDATLTRWGFEVVVARDGAEAWQVLEGDDAPELIILDWVMPGRDGLELCHLIRQQASARYRYVLLVTARHEKQDRLRGLEAGADDYLSKPLDIAELRARLAAGRRILQLQDELITARERMRLLATRDALTGVWNRGAILDVFERELSRCRREQLPLGVALADIDHFKPVNDSYGHLVGDAVLQQVAARMATALRPYDLIGRYGGEEFLILLPGCTESATVKVCERLRGVIADHPTTHNGRTVPVTVSIGCIVSEVPHDKTSRELLHAADEALYHAKRQGRNRVMPRSLV